jgi:hypothetical protein
MPTEFPTSSAIPAIPVSEPTKPYSAGDLWHDRLTQFAHRALCVSCVVLAAAWAAPDRIPQTLGFSIAIYAAILALVCSFCATFLIRPEDNYIRESLGVLLLSVLPLAAGLWRVAGQPWPGRPTGSGWVIVYHAKEILVGECLKPWLTLSFGPDPWPWICRAALFLLVLWVGLTTALTRRGGE